MENEVEKEIQLKIWCFTEVSTECNQSCQFKINISKDPKSAIYTDNNSKLKYQ